jgi:hypothetical protein
LAPHHICMVCRQRLRQAESARATEDVRRLCVCVCVGGWLGGWVGDLAARLLKSLVPEAAVLPHKEAMSECPGLALAPRVCGW